MNKKILLFLLIFLSSIFGLFVNVSYAQKYTEADMSAVTVRFCSEGSGESTHDAIYYIEPGQEKSIRLCITNGGGKKVGFEYGFSESGIGKGRFCQGNIGTGNRFSMLIPWTKERNILIEPNSNLVIEEKIVIPPGMSGLQLGCIGYNLVQPENTLVGGMFSLKIRKVGYMDIVVGGESTVKSSIKVLTMAGGIFSTNKKVKAEVDNKNRLKLTFQIANEGNIGQKITITGMIYNTFGFQKEFSVTTKQIGPGSSNEFTTDVAILPSYKGFFNVSFNIQNEPQFMFPITNEKLKQPGYISDTATLFLFSWIRVIALIVILLVLYKLFVPRRVKAAKA